MSRIGTWVCLLFVFCMFTTGCADFTRKMDIAMYGSEEEADAARAKHRADELRRNSKKSQELAAETLAAVRQERKKHRLYPTTGNEALHELAQLRAQEIITRYSATRPNDLPSLSLYADFEQLAKVRPIRELRAKGLKKPADVINYWLSRDEDKKVLFGSRIRGMEIGLAIVDTTYYWVLVSYE